MRFPFRGLCVAETSPRFNPIAPIGQQVSPFDFPDHPTSTDGSGLSDF